MKDKKNSDMNTCKKVVPLVGEVKYSCSQEESQEQEKVNQKAADSWLEFRDNALKSAQPFMYHTFRRGPGL